MKKLVLYPLSRVFSLAVGVRKKIYELNLIEKGNAGVPVISVGNITVGGTGKTPVVDYLIKNLSEKGIKVGVVSRGYGSKVIGPIRVIPGRAMDFGDEPSMLVKRNPSTPVVIGANRLDACRFLLNQCPDVKCIVADDAFQHLKLNRDLDIIVIDATEPLENYEPLPLGRAREKMISLKRAGLVILNKINLAAPQNVVWLKENIKIINPNLSMVEFSYKISGLKYVTNDQTYLPDSNENFFLVSGIGRASTFRSLVESSFSLKIVGEYQFPDHYSYKPEHIPRLLMDAKRVSADRILVTEKDAVKIKPFANDEFIYASLDIIPQTPMDSFNEQVNSIFT